MTDIILTIGGWLFGLACAVGGWVFKMIFQELREHKETHAAIDKKVDDHKLHVAENYITKIDFKDLFDKISNQLTRIEDKLDKKVDK